MKKDIFVGELTEKELGVIEDALVFYKNQLPYNTDNVVFRDKTVTPKYISNLISKLYKFWEK